MEDQITDQPDDIDDDDDVASALAGVASDISAAAGTSTRKAPKFVREETKRASKPRSRIKKMPAKKTKPGVSKDITRTASAAEAEMTPEEQAARAEKRRLAHERLSNNQCPICGTTSPKHDFHRPAFVLCPNAKCSVMYHTYPMSGAPSKKGSE